MALKAYPFEALARTRKKSMPEPIPPGLHEVAEATRACNLVRAIHIGHAGECPAGDWRPLLVPTTDMHVPSLYARALGLVDFGRVVASDSNLCPCSCACLIIESWRRSGSQACCALHQGRSREPDVPPCASNRRVPRESGAGWHDPSRR